MMPLSVAPLELQPSLTGLALAVVIALAGGLGASARHAVELLAARLGGWRSPRTLAVVNIAGSFLAGLLAGAAASAAGSLDPIDPAAHQIIGTGFLGGFTTFSAASLALVETDQAEGRNAAIVLALVMTLGSIAACFAGFWLAG